MKYFINSVILFLLNFSVFAQDFYFNSLTVKDGLSQHDVSDIIQDSEGFIWIGTYDGLNRFNGYEVENFYHIIDNPSTLSSNRIKCLFDDGNKKIWIGTDGYGLNYYSIKEDKIYRIKAPVNYEIINDISKNNKGEIIVATTQGLFKIIEKKENFSLEIIQSPITGTNVRKIKILKDNRIIYLTSSGIWLHENEQYKLIYQEEQNFYTAICQTENEKVWISSRNGLYELIGNKIEKKINEIGTNITSIIEGKNNILWIGTSDNGLVKIDTKNFSVYKINASDEIMQRSLVNNSLNNLYKDSTNTIWIANKQGVLYINLESQQFKRLPIIKRGHVRTLFSVDNYVYYGFLGDKFYRYNLKTKTNELLNIKKTAKSFDVDTLNGKIHLATTKGLYKQIEPEKNRFELVSIFNNKSLDTAQIITSFAKDNLGNVYYGTFKGLIVQNKLKTEWVHRISENLELLRNVRIFTLYFDYKNKCLWVGTISNGLFKLNFDENGKIISTEEYNEQMSGAYKIPNNSVWSFYQDNKGTFYVGTDTGLLYKNKNENKFSSVLSEHINNKKIMGIIEDEFSNLWLTTSLGIINYFPKTNTSKIYNFYDGLLTNNFTEGISKNNKNELFFANIEGINFLESAKILQNPTTSNIVLTKLLVNKNKVEVNEEILGSVLLQKSLNFTEKIKFNHKQNDFTIEFASTNYASSFNNKYRYKLEKYNKEWQIVDSKKRFASYSNIPSGSYTFYVEATNPNGEWSGNVKQLKITIVPAPWLSLGAYLLYFLIVAATFYVLFDFWNNKQKLKNQIKLSNLKNEQEKEINEMKLVFFTDVAHEFKTPLSLIIGPLKDLIDGNLTKEQREFNYNILSRSTNRMMNLVNQLLDFRKVNSGVNILKVSRNDLCNFIREIAKSFEWQSKNRNILFNVIGPESYICHFDKDILEKAIYNLLSNAFKYTPNNGTIEVEIKPTWKQDLEYFVILIKDSGKGISQLDKKNIFRRYFHGEHRSSSGIGLHLTATLIEAHKGEINVLNSSLGGTEFMITLPVSAKAYSETEFLTKDDIPVGLQQEYLLDEVQEIIDDENNESKERILLVEDDYDLRKYLKNILKTDYIIHEASDGIEGIEKTLEIMPDIIITDVMMPEMDGIEMCKRIKKNILISHIPILMLTAKTGDEFYSKGLKVGAWDYIAKPFNSNQLLQKVKNITETRNQFREVILKGKSKEVENHYVSHDQKFVKHATNIINQKMSDTNFSVVELAAELGLSRMQLHRKLKSLIGLSTTAFINSVKIKKAKSMFDNGCDRVQEAMDLVGISSYAHFNSLFKKEIGKTPSNYIENVKEHS